MNPFEKLLMIIVPFVGLSAMMYFFTFYLPDVENGNLFESNRLQGESQIRTISTPRLVNKIHNNKVVNKTSVKKDYIKWQSEESTTYMPQSLKNKVYKRTA